MSLYDKLSDRATLRSAWKSLHKNPNSYGIDAVTINDFRDNLELELERLSAALKAGTYKPNVLRGHPLEKGNASSKNLDKTDYRILKIPTVRDRVVQKAIEQLIGPALNKKYNIDRNGVSFAYMKGGGVDRAADKIRSYYLAGNAWAYSADIKGFFDNIEKAQLLTKIAAALPDKSLNSLIEQFFTIDIANAEQIVERTRKEYEYNPLLGVAQGSPLSPMFANVYLAQLDTAVIAAKLNMVRYADDIVVLCRTKDEAVAAHHLIEAELQKLSLEAHPLLVVGELPEEGHNKHSRVQKYSGLLFLGLRFTGDKIHPSAASYKNAIWTVRRAAMNKKLTFIKKLISIESRVQGWCSSYAFTDYLDEPTRKNDKLLEDILTKTLGSAGLKKKPRTTAISALGILSYSERLHNLQSERKAKEEESAKTKKSI